MKKILLTKGKFTIVDNEDWIKLREWRWYCSTTGYAVTNYKDKKLYMHRIITNAPKGKEVDHKNFDKLDNRKANLRICTKAENRMNKQKEWDNSSGYLGVCWSKARGKWLAYTRFNNRFVHIGYFSAKEQAAKAYNQKTIELHGKFANPNIL